jgi:hypothetical protein
VGCIRPPMEVGTHWWVVTQLSAEAGSASSTYVYKLVLRLAYRTEEELVVELSPSEVLGGS